ncbi:MAG TPA: helix-turn-helix domain-containing protein [Candidatus Acidoferrales bacterium]
MLIGQRLRELRESKKLSQGDIEKRTGLLRCYTSRVEHGHTVPNVETLEKYARALEVPLYMLFYEGEEPPKKPKLLSTGKPERPWGTSGAEGSGLRTLAKALRRMDERKRKLLLRLAEGMARRNRAS